MNAITSYLDGSNVYGSSAEEVEGVIDTGRFYNVRRYVILRDSMYRLHNAQ